MMEYKGYFGKVEFDDYLDFYASHGEEPEKPYSGKFIICVDPELHKSITIEAKKTGKSLNAWVSESLSKVIHTDTQRSN